jgi:hypothetical protein
MVQRPNLLLRSTESRIDSDDRSPVGGGRGVRRADRADRLKKRAQGRSVPVDALSGALGTARSDWVSARVGGSCGSLSDFLKGLKGRANRPHVVQRRHVGRDGTKRGVQLGMGLLGRQPPLHCNLAS